MRSSLHILVPAVMASLGAAQPLAAQAADWWERPLLERGPRADAELTLELALCQEKASGALDSAVAGYERVLSLYRKRRATAATANRARARLDRLEAAGLLADLHRGERGSASAAAPVTSAVAGVTQLAQGLQRGAALVHEIAPDARPPRPHSPDPLPGRRRWLERALRLQTTHRADARSGPQAWVAGVGSAMGALRRALGLRGIQHYVDTELLRHRPRTLSEHEQLLSALWAEKEQGDFSGAAQRYHDLARLSPTGGIATRLSERARLGVARCARWQRAASGDP